MISTNDEMLEVGVGSSLSALRLCVPHVRLPQKYFKQ